MQKILFHHQKSVFKGEITPANFIKFESEIKKVTDKNLDTITILRLFRQTDVKEIIIGENDSDKIFL